MTAAAFQSTVSLNQGFGVPGELFNDGPRRAQSFIINSALASYNVFGRGFSITAEGKAAAGNSGTAQFAGILVNPKGSASRGDGTDPLNPTLTIQNQAQGECLTMGSIVVSLPATAAIGDLVVYDDTTGILSTITPSTPLPAGKSPAYARVDYFTVSGAGLAVITLDPTITYVPAE